MSSLTGQNIDGYRVGALLGTGGMGEVYQAFAEDNKQVAIKFLRADYAHEPTFQGRFAREIRIMQALKHDNIMPIFDHGIHDQMLYYTMRLIQGVTLNTAMKRQKYSPQTWWEILEQVCRALTYGHAQRLVHRDIKPDNIFLERNKETGKTHVYLGDFGLGKRIGVDHNLTEADAILGTPMYISPEAAIGEALDPRADIYSLSVVTYEVLLGKVPFMDAAPHLTAMAHITKPVPRPSLINEDFPQVLEDVIMHALEKDQMDRTPSAETYAQEYQEALAVMTEEQRTKVYAG
jgi:serine/threonine protein kinase